jgi:hypothetical protein
MGMCLCWWHGGSRPLSPLAAAWGWEPPFLSARGFPAASQESAGTQPNTEQVVRVQDALNKGLAPLHLLS